jgi:hypothetical protein
MKSMLSKEHNEYNNTFLYALFSMVFASAFFMLSSLSLIQIFKEKGVPFWKELLGLFLNGFDFIVIYICVTYAVNKWFSIKLFLFSSSFLFVKKILFALFVVAFYVSTLLCAMELFEMRFITHVKDHELIHDFYALMFCFAFGTIASLVVLFTNKRYYDNVYIPLVFRK